jgi:hypothetical protein
VNDLDVKFQINPLARSELDLNPSLTDDQMSTAIKSAFQISGGTATLTDYSLFPANTLYLVDQDIRYGIGVNSGIESTLVTASVPEPPALALGSIVALALSGRGWLARLIRRRLTGIRERSDALS